MLVLAIAGVMFGLAIPNMRDFMWNNRMTGRCQRPADGRVSRPQRIGEAAWADDSVLHRRLRGSQPACNGDGTQGWVMFADANNNGQADADEDVILRHGAAAGHAQRQIDAGRQQRLSRIQPRWVRSQHRARNGSVRGRDLRLPRQCRHHGPRLSAARGVIITPTGRPKVTRIVSRHQGDTEQTGGCP